MFLPTDPAVVVILTNGRSGHSDYDRGIRDNMSDARWPGSETETYWWHRAMTQAHLTLLGQRWNPTAETWDEARRRALDSLAPFGHPKMLDDIATEMNRYAPTLAGV